MTRFTSIFLVMLIAGCQSTTMPSKTPQEELMPVTDGLSLEEVCRVHTCRENVRVKFRTDGEPIDQTIPLYWPRVFNDVISILPGESFLVEAELVEDRLSNLKEVPENLNPEQTIVIEFKQSDKDIGMMLSLFNPFDGMALKFNMDMIDFEGNGHHTSSCPAFSKAYIFESWPHPIPELVVSNPRALPTDENLTFTCEY